MTIMTEEHPLDYLAFAPCPLCPCVQIKPTFGSHMTWQDISALQKGGQSVLDYINIEITRSELSMINTHAIQ